VSHVVFGSKGVRGHPSPSARNNSTIQIQMQMISMSTNHHLHLPSSSVTMSSSTSLSQFIAAQSLVPNDHPTRHRRHSHRRRRRTSIGAGPTTEPASAGTSFSAALARSGLLLLGRPRKMLQ
jgi:hypothetical protein